MDTLKAFLDATRQEGYGQQAAQAVYHTVRARLNQAGYPDQTTFYIYRIPGGKGPAGGGTGKPRVLLVFSSPDAALAFAQHRRIKPQPRLQPITLALLLTALVQHPAIHMVVFAEEQAPIDPTTHLPTVLQLGRQHLFDMLRERDKR